MISALTYKRELNPHILTKNHRLIMSADESIETLLKWASDNSITLNGIQPEVLPGRGIGILATRDVKAGEDILQVPTPLLRTFDSTPRTIISRLTGATVHAILAAALSLDMNNPPEDFLPWKAVFPTKADIQMLMPLCWPLELQELLSDTSQDLLSKQRAKFEKDWALVSKSYPDMSREDYQYAWLLINTRTFYHTTPRTKKSLLKDDRIALQPVADLFNHSPDGCTVSYSYQGFTITTTKPASKGEELFIRYGFHSNDFLLTEYGFILESNTSDSVCLDEYIKPLLNKEKKSMLDGRGYWGRYMLGRDGACYRTQIALRTLVLRESQWLMVLDGLRGEDVDQDAVNAILLKALRQYLKDIEVVKARVNDASTGDITRNTLRDRWQQIQDLIEATVKELS